MPRSPSSYSDQWFVIWCPAAAEYRLPCVWPGSRQVGDCPVRTLTAMARLREQAPRVQCRASATGDKLGQTVTLPRPGSGLKSPQLHRRSAPQGGLDCPWIVGLAYQIRSNPSCDTKLSCDAK